MSIALFILLVLIAIAGIILATFQLPGVWIILAAAVGYDGYLGWQAFGWKWLLALTLIAGVGELLDALAGAALAHRGGASRRASLGALIGGFAGMIVFTIPVPLIGTIIGGLLGCFLGAVIGELSLHDDLYRGARIGALATAGRLVGIVLKTAVAIAVAGAIIVLAWLATWP